MFDQFEKVKLMIEWKSLFDLNERTDERTNEGRKDYLIGIFSVLFFSFDWKASRDFLKSYNRSILDNEPKQIVYCIVQYDFINGKQTVPRSFCYWKKINDWLVAQGRSLNIYFPIDCHSIVSVTNWQYELFVASEKKQSFFLFVFLWLIVHLDRISVQIYFYYQRSVTSRLTFNDFHIEHQQKPSFSIFDGINIVHGREQSRFGLHEKEETFELVFLLTGRQVSVWKSNLSPWKCFKKKRWVPKSLSLTEKLWKMQISTGNVSQRFSDHEQIRSVSEELKQRTK